MFRICSELFRLVQNCSELVIIVQNSFRICPILNNSEHILNTTVLLLGKEKSFSFSLFLPFVHTLGKILLILPCQFMSLVSDPPSLCVCVQEKILGKILLILSCHFMSLITYPASLCVCVQEVSLLRMHLTMAIDHVITYLLDCLRFMEKKKSEV